VLPHSREVVSEENRVEDLGENVAAAWKTLLFYTELVCLLGLAIG
jgi:hypothetical protein